MFHSLCQVRFQVDQIAFRFSCKFMASLVEDQLKRQIEMYSLHKNTHRRGSCPVLPSRGALVSSNNRLERRNSLVRSIVCVREHRFQKERWKILRKTIATIVGVLYDIQSSLAASPCHPSGVLQNFLYWDRKRALASPSSSSASSSISAPSSSSRRAILGSGHAIS